MRQVCAHAGIIDTEFAALVRKARPRRVDNTSIKVRDPRPVPEAAGADVATYISPITAWKVGQLVWRNRLSPGTTPQRWFARILAIRNVLLTELSPDILIAASFLPGTPPKDPADRILLATARDLAATLVTRDREILAYGERGNVSVLAC
jgi:PIN domain nuclease of toxin-antitoxin system